MGRRRSLPRPPSKPPPHAGASSAAPVPWRRARQPPADTRRTMAGRQRQRAAGATRRACGEHVRAGRCGATPPEERGGRRAARSRSGGGAHWAQRPRRAAAGRDVATHTSRSRRGGGERGHAPPVGLRSVQRPVRPPSPTAASSGEAPPLLKWRRARASGRGFPPPPAWGARGVGGRRLSGVARRSPPEEWVHARDGRIRTPRRTAFCPFPRVPPPPSAHLPGVGGYAPQRPGCPCRVLAHPHSPLAPAPAPLPGPRGRHGPPPPG